MLAAFSVRRRSNAVGIDGPRDEHRPNPDGSPQMESSLRHYPKPPANFDPLTASYSQLRKHGFPARPDSPKLLQRYTEIFGRLKHKLNFLEPKVAVRNSGRSSSLASGRLGSGTARLVLPGNIAGGKVATGSGSGGRGFIEDPAWSGALVYPLAGQSIKCAIGEFQVPDVDFPSDSDGS